MNPEAGREDGRYLYCIINSGEEMDFGEMGIENSQVYTVPFRDIAAVVHRCKAQLYKTDEKEKAGELVLAHQFVIDLATKEFGTVVPLTFDTIFKGDDEGVKKWLNKKYRYLKALLEKFSGKAEYGVQVFIEKSFLEREVEKNVEVQRLKKTIEGRSKGAAYLLKKKLEKKLELERKRVLDMFVKKLFNQIRKLADDVKTRSTSETVPKKWQNKPMFLNLSCLVHEDRIESLTDILKQVNDKQGVTVRFTGPWSPFSFSDVVRSSQRT